MTSESNEEILTAPTREAPIREAPETLARPARASAGLSEDASSVSAHPANNGRAARAADGAAQDGRPDAEEKLEPLSETDRFFDLVIAELAALRTRAEGEAICRAVDLIIECEGAGGRVHVTGVGKSEYVARYAASLLSSTGTPAYFLHATECVHGSAGQLCKSDIAIAISKSGTTPELMSAVALLQQMNIGIIGVSGNTASPLAGVSDVLLY